MPVPPQVVRNPFTSAVDAITDLPGASLENSTTAPDFSALYAHLVNQQVRVRRDIMKQLQAWYELDDSRMCFLLQPLADNDRATIGIAEMLAGVWDSCTTNIISYACNPAADIPRRDGMSTQQIGQVSMLYSLIDQLMEFDEEKQWETLVPSDLDGTMATWDLALSMLGVLLKEIPQETLCVIDHVHRFDSSIPGAGFSKELVDILEAESASGLAGDKPILKVVFTSTRPSPTIMGLAGVQTLLAEGLCLYNYSTVSRFE